MFSFTFFIFQDLSEGHTFTIAGLTVWRHVLHADRKKLLSELLSGRLAVCDFCADSFQYAKNSHANQVAWDMFINSADFKFMSNAEKQKFKCATDLIVSCFTSTFVFVLYSSS